MKNFSCLSLHGFCRILVRRTACTVLMSMLCIAAMAQKAVPFTVEALGRVYLNDNKLELSFDVQGESIVATMAKVSNKQLVTDDFDTRYEDGKILLTGARSSGPFKRPLAVSLLGDGSVKIGTLVYRPMKGGAHEGERQLYVPGMAMPAPTGDKLFYHYGLYPTLKAPRADSQVTITEYLNLEYLLLVSRLDSLDVHCSADGTVKLTPYTDDASLKAEVEALGANLKATPAMRKDKPVPFATMLNVSYTDLCAVLKNDVVLNPKYSPLPAGSKVPVDLIMFDDTKKLPRIIYDGKTLKVNTKLRVAKSDMTRNLGIDLGNIQSLCSHSDATATAIVNKTTNAYKIDGKPLVSLTVGSKLPVRWQEGEWSYMLLGETLIKVASKDLSYTPGAGQFKPRNYSQKTVIKKEGNNIDLANYVYLSAPNCFLNGERATLEISVDGKVKLIEYSGADAGKKAKVEGVVEGISSMTELLVSPTVKDGIPKQCTINVLAPSHNKLFAILDKDTYIYESAELKTKIHQLHKGDTIAVNSFGYRTKTYTHIVVERSHRDMHTTSSTKFKAIAVGLNREDYCVPIGDIATVTMLIPTNATVTKATYLSSLDKNNKKVKALKVKAGSRLDIESVDGKLGNLANFDFNVDMKDIDYSKDFVRKQQTFDDFASEIVLENVDVAGVVETPPQFPGGDAACLMFLNRNLQYPPKAQDLGIQGKVVCSFIVDVDGSISEIEILRSPDPSLSQEAIRVIKLMPKWKPGTQRGKPVRVKYTMPVVFRLT